MRFFVLTRRIVKCVKFKEFFSDFKFQVLNLFYKVLDDANVMRSITLVAWHLYHLKLTGHCVKITAVFKITGHLSFTALVYDQVQAYQNSHKFHNRSDTTSANLPFVKQLFQTKLPHYKPFSSLSLYQLPYWCFIMFLFQLIEVLSLHCDPITTLPGYLIINCLIIFKTRTSPFWDQKVA